MEITFIQAIAVLAAGLASGFINTMAGGGSFIALAALDFAGLPITVANGTNRVAVLMGGLSSSAAFRSKGLSDFRTSLHFAIPALIGSLVGARVASQMADAAFERVVGVAMLFVLATMLVNPTRLLGKRIVTLTPRRKLLLIYPTFFVVGLYGGAIQAGVGFLLVVALMLAAGQNLLRSTFHKVVIVSVYTAAALLTFALNNQVNWALGVILAIGSGLGAWLTSHLAIAKGERLIKWVLGVMLVVLSLRYLGVLQF